MSGEEQRPDGGTIQESDVFASEEEGMEYRDTAYKPVEVDELERAPESDEYPGQGQGGSYHIADLPRVPKVNHIVGPSAVMLGASLGSGETLFWPLLIAQNGWALYWAFWVGVLTQFFINTEIQRWTIATGESIFQAYDRIHSFWPWFFLVAGFFHVGWPGWAAGAAEVFAAGLLGSRDAWVIPGIGLMVLIWLSYQLHPLMYNVVEKAQVVMMILAVSVGIILVFIAGSIGQLASVPGGAVSFGTLPTDMDIAVFLGGLAYAGAGGYVNLAQGVWSREKGYGMGSYQGRIKNPLIGDEPEPVEDDGFVFEPTSLNMQRWKGWWKVTQIEHLLTFVLGLLIVATVMMTISREYAAGIEESEAIVMWLDFVAPSLGGVQGALVYVMLFIALFTTEYAILEAFVRNSVDIIYEMYGRAAGWSLPRVFWGTLTAFTLWGIIIIGAQFDQPFILLVIGAAIAGVMMWPYNALTVILNTTKLPEHTAPGWGRVIAMWWATGFFGYFSVLLIADQAVSRFGLTTFETSVAVVGSNTGAYVLWAFMIVVQIYTMYRSGKAKVEMQDTVPNADEAKGLLS
jgi:hypothetical protein